MATQLEPIVVTAEEENKQLEFYLFPTSTLGMHISF